MEKCKYCIKGSILKKCQDGNCPKGANSRCFIILAKKRTVTVKAWALIDSGKFVEAFSHNVASFGNTLKPCKVIIDAKCLKDKTNEKEKR